jgi:L-threonylcarbamoyladenylate synthase
MMRAERISLERLLFPEGRKKFEDLAASIKQGAVFIYPTETIYGIGGMFGVQGVEDRIFRIKQRQTDQRLIVIAADRSGFDALHLAWPPSAARLATAFWPGLLTLVLPDETGVETAIRVSPHPFIIALCTRLHSPVYSTSANVSGTPYVNDSDMIYERFKGAVDFMIDAGQLIESPPSTIVRISLNNTISILRHGAIDPELIRKAL